MPRNASLDYARLIAALGIVLFHAGAPGASIGYAALPFFLMVLIVLALPVAGRMDFASFARGRADRLLGPFVRWSLVYGGLKLAEVVISGRPLAAEFEPWMLLAGPAIHLWFLPFAFAASLAVYPLARLSLQDMTPQTRNRRRLVGLAVLTGLALLAQSLQDDRLWSTPFAQWGFALPAVFLGLGFGLAFPQSSPQAHAQVMLQGQLSGSLSGTVMMPATLGAAVGGLVLVAWAAGWMDGLLQLGVAAVALLVCLTVRLRQTALSQAAARIALGVYLCHPLIGSMLLRLINMDQHSLGFAALTGLGSVLLAWGLDHLQRRIRSGRGLRPAS